MGCMIFTQKIKYTLMNRYDIWLQHLFPSHISNCHRHLPIHLLHVCMHCMCSTGPFTYRWLKGNIYSSCHYHHQIRSIHLSHCFHIFSVAVCLRCLLHHILSLIVYTCRENRECVFISIVQFVTSANIRIRFGLQIVFVCFYITPSHNHHCANFIWRHWTYEMSVRYNLSSVWVKLSIFSELSIIQYVGLCVFILPISFVMIERTYILCHIIIIKSKVWTITHCLGLGHETMVWAVCLSIFLSNRKYQPYPLSYFFVVVSLRCLLHHILSRIAYTFRENRYFVFIIIVRFMMSANSRIRFGSQIVFFCLFITPSHYHHCANLSEDIDLIKCLSAIFSRVCE